MQTFAERSRFSSRDESVQLLSSLQFVYDKFSRLSISYKSKDSLYLEFTSHAGQVLLPITYIGHDHA